MNILKPKDAQEMEESSAMRGKKMASAKQFANHEDISLATRGIIISD
jgi:hypothetical protein